MNVGQYLQACRLQKGLSLEGVANKTRISLAYLRALESWELPKLPPLIFVKAYLRTYSICLGLQEADVMRRFAESISGSPDQRQPGSLATIAKRVKAQNSLETRLEKGWAYMTGLFRGKSRSQEGITSLVHSTSSLDSST